MKSAILRPFLGLLLAACVLVFRRICRTPERSRKVRDGFLCSTARIWTAGIPIWIPSGKNKDPKGVFKVENGMIHILDVPMSGGKSDNGYLATTQEFSNVRIHVEYKWGAKRASEGKRNSGLLYLAVGPDRIYPTSLECQIEETDVGDLWIVNGASVTAFFIAPSFPMYDDDMQAGTRVRSAPGDSLPRAEVRGLREPRRLEQRGCNSPGRSNHAPGKRPDRKPRRDIQRPDPTNPSRMIPLKSGRILLEAEGSEIWFRDVRVKPLGPRRSPDTKP